MKPKLKNLLILGVFSTICLVGSAQASLATRVNAVIARPSQKKVQFSIHIIKADSRKTVYSHNARETLIPASNMKIIVTAAALEYLGPNYKYVTKVGLSDSTLVVIGSGDPLLGDRTTDAKHGRETGWVFKDIISALKSKGVTAIEDIIVDSSIFDDQYVHPNWPEKELNRWYACELSGLNFNRNCIELSTENVRGRVIVIIEPQTRFVKFVNRVKPVSKGSSAVGTYRTRTPNHLIVHGRCRVKAGPFPVAIEKAAAFFGFLLAEHLPKAGIKTAGKVIEKALADTSQVTPLCEFTTPMADCFARCNKVSLGLAAEALLKTIAVHSKPDSKNGSWVEGQAMIARYLVDIGVDRSQFHIDDGSGLSRQNQLSAYAITRVLSDVYRSGNWTFYKDSLAVGGVDGTIRTYFKDDKYKGKVFGKTGYLSGVKSLSGLCTTPKGDYIFSILTNKANAYSRKAINDIVQAIIDEAHE